MQCVNKSVWLMQDELDDILRYGAAELFADAVAASQKAQQAAATGDPTPLPPFLLWLFVQPSGFRVSQIAPIDNPCTF